MNAVSTWSWAENLGHKSALGLQFRISVFVNLSIFFLGEMRGEDKPYEMPVAPQEPERAPSGLSKQKQHQLARQYTNNLAIQESLQHLSPVHPQKVTTR